MIATNEIAQEITRIVTEEMRTGGDAMIARLRRNLERANVTFQADALNSFHCKILEMGGGAYRLELYFFSYLRFSEIWKTKYRGLPNVDAIAAWLTQRGIEPTTKSGKTSTATPAKIKAAAFAIAKYKQDNPAKKKVKKWYAKTVFNGAYSIFLSLVDTLSDEQIQFFKDAANQ